MGKMQPKSDAQLLREYAEGGPEAAFSELVHRHTNLVYSAALRQVESPAEAAEIAQCVFIGLAQGAKSLLPRLASEASLAGWLCRSARNLSLNFRRDKFRRHARERHVMEQLVSAADDAPDWERLRLFLDDAMSELDETDYDALVLRFYQNQNFRAVGAAIGFSDDTAQKRVTRALEKLRGLLSKRGIRTTAATLSVVIAANAVRSAPVGLAATISAAVLAGTAVTTSTAVAITKTIAMTTLQKALITVTVAALAGAGIYEARQAARLRDQNQLLMRQQAEQIQKLERERDGALDRLATLSKKVTLRLPAPALPLVAQTNVVATTDLPSTNLYSRFKEKMPKLTRTQVESYLQTNGRTASSLLAGYRTSRDKELLKEAMQKFPNDPQVAYEAAFDPDLSPAEKRQWLNTFEQSSPDNATANYLSALNYFNAGQIDQGIQELTAASGKQFQDYTLDRWRNDEEAYLSAGYSPAESGYISTFDLTLPQLAQVKQLGQDLVDLSSAYGKSGDQASAQAALQMALNLGQRYVSSSAGEAVIDQVVGIAVERMALASMNPNSPYGDTGRTVQDQLNQLTQQRVALRSLVQQVDGILPTVSDQDWVNYTDRWMVFGEAAANQWLVEKYGQK
jgi:RNA polymerase sigma factor (sigma-70 family)